MFFPKCLTSLVLVAANVCFLLNIDVCRANPGIRVQITKKGLDYANELALNKMYEEVKNMKIPEVSKSGSTSYSLFNTRISRVSKPSGQVLLVPGQGLKWSVSINGYYLSAKFRISKKVLWKRIRKTVSLSMNIRNIRLELTFKPTKATNGGLDLKAAHCSSNVDVKVSSGNVIVKLFLRFFRSKINSIIKKKLCDSAVKIVNNDVAKKLANFPVTRRISDGYFFDYSLVSNPVFTSTYMQTNHKAAILDKNKNGNFPFTAQKFPEINENNKMIYFIISDYSLNTWLYTAHRDNKLMFNVTAEKVKTEKQRKMFRTTCPGSICAGTFFPTISQTYPNSTIEINFVTSKQPSVKFEPNQIQMSVPVNVEFSAVRSNGERAKFLTAEMVLFSKLRTTFAHENILFKVTNTTFTLGKIYGAATGTFAMTAIKELLRIVVKLVETILPGQQFPLVVPSNTLLSNPTMRVVKNGIIVASDLTITSI